MVAHRVNVIRDIVLLSEREAISLFSRYAFGRENPLHGYEELSRKVVRYAVGLPLTVKVLGSFLCGKDKLEWVNAIDRLKRIPLKETLEKLELSYISLEDDYKEIFLDIACILKGKTPDEPNKHSHLWNDEEIEDILANDMGTEATRCLKCNTSSINERIFMKGLGKMKKLRYLEVNFPYYGFESDAEYFKQTILLDFICMIAEKWYNFVKEGEKKVLKKLKSLFLYESSLTKFDFRITPNLESLSLEISYELEELCMPFSCHKLKYLCIGHSKLTFDLGLTPYLETLSLYYCTHFVKLEVSVACPNLKFLNLCKSRLRRVDLELIPNLERLDLAECHELVEINAPIGCLKMVGYLNLRDCLRFADFEFYGRERKVNCSSATLDLDGQSLDLCPLHPNSSKNYQRRQTTLCKSKLRMVMI
ncbi:Toll/interleukin-1 receptor domain-containing protein [Tanacetum coccineum]